MTPLSLLVLVICGSSARAYAQDWRQWRGPHGDGVVHGVTVPKLWPKTLKEEWKVPVGRGVASPVVVGGNIYVFAGVKDDEFVLCLDLASGNEIWRSEPNAAPYKTGGGEDPFTARNRPRSTPAVAGGRVFTLWMSRILSCLDPKPGKVVWRKSSKSPPSGGTSPFGADGLCIVQAADAKTGGRTAFVAS